MSDATALALVVTSMCAGYAAYVYTWKRAHEVSLEIVTGTALSLPLPATWRRYLLYSRWIYLPLAISSFHAAVGAVNIKVAELTTDQGVGLVAYFVAVVSAFAAIASVASGVLEFLHLRSIVRQTEAD
jgi:hypothetical protein